MQKVSLLDRVRAGERQESYKLADVAELWLSDEFDHGAEELQRRTQLLVYLAERKQVEVYAEQVQRPHLNTFWIGRTRPGGRLDTSGLISLRTESEQRMTIDAMRKSLPVLAGHCRIGAGLTLLCGTPQGNQLTAPTAQPHCSDAESKITGRKVKRHELTKILCEEYGANSIEVDRVLDKPRRHPWLQACMPRRGVYFLEPALVGFDEELALINRAKRARPDRRGVIAVK